MSTPTSRAQEVRATEPDDGDEGGRGSRLLDLVERAGNALPHPFWLFWILGGVVACVSWALHASGLHVEDPSSGDLVGVRSALSAAAVRDLISGAEESFVTFGPLGTLRDAGLVRSTRDGKLVRHRLATDVVQRLGQDVLATVSR